MPKQAPSIQQLSRSLSDKIERTLKWVRRAHKPEPSDREDSFELRAEFVRREQDVWKARESDLLKELRAAREYATRCQEELKIERAKNAQQVHDLTRRLNLRIQQLSAQNKRLNQQLSLNFKRTAQVARPNQNQPPREQKAKASSQLKSFASNAIKKQRSRDREQARPEARPEARTETRVEARTQAKTERASKSKSRSPELQPGRRRAEQLRGRGKFGACLVR